MVSSGKKSACLLGCGSVLVVVGAVMLVFWPPIFLAQLQRMMVLTNDSMSFGLWREIPIPMYLQCYMFNIVNVDDILAGKNVTIKVEQLGPYVFREFQIKENITWNNHNSTVTFYNKRTWQFRPELSNGSLSDNVTSINPIVVTVAYLLRHQNDVLKFVVDSFMRRFHEHLFLTANVSSWLFDGIDDPILDIASHFPDLPFEIPFYRFGWFYDRNTSLEYDGSFIMNTGASDFSQLGNLEKWRYSNQTIFRDWCGKVHGSTGELWAPELGQPEVTIFASDICTHLSLHKAGTVTVHGIEGVQYAANDSLFDNGYRYPKMACYCDEVRDENCMPSGALNVSACRYGAPAFVTLPHFLNMDPYYASKIDGLRPTEEHNFWLALEMFTGMPLAVSAQLQINMLVRYITAFSLNNRLPDADTLVPMFWFRQELKIDEDYANLARFALNLRYKVPYGFYALTAIGVGLLTIGVWILVRRIFRSPDTMPILADSAQEETN